jgi:hypothetical protein
MYFKINAMKIPVVKEHGSWVVFIFSSVIGIAAGLRSRPWRGEGDLLFVPVLTIMGLAALINSKSPLASALRAKSGKMPHLAWFTFFAVAGIFMLSPFLYSGFKTVVVFLPLVACYVILLSFDMEHKLLVELLGFSILSLSSPSVYFTVTGEMSYRLYLAVFIFFGAGVFKVRMRLKKDLKYRLLMILYCAFSLVIFHLTDMILYILLPLVENIVSAVRMREEKLRTTGNIELVKGLMFTGLLIFFWR